MGSMPLSAEAPAQPGGIIHMPETHPERQSRGVIKKSKGSGQSTEFLPQWLFTAEWQLKYLVYEVIRTDNSKKKKCNGSDIPQKKKRGYFKV